MKTFECDNCGNPVFFENDSCVKCKNRLGYLHTKLEMVSSNPSTDIWNLEGDERFSEYRYCKNHDLGVCNWLTKYEREYCIACTLNRTIPNLANIENFEKWQRLEIAKHRLLYQMQRLELPLKTKFKNDDSGLCFDFLSNKNKDNPIMTGHVNGVITIFLSEADSVHREQMRKHLSEPYRTLIAHFRHEVGHYYWDRLIHSDEHALENFRKVFGDEREDYGDALKKYYATGAPDSWQNNHISKYATSHPWEDWAETWAHYLHVMDTMETAYFFGITTEPKSKSDEIIRTSKLFDPYKEGDFQKIVESCIPIFFAINSINRAMGIPDVYPFVTNTPVIEKMKFIHDILMHKRNLP